jgi:hypothetical protein
MDLSTTPPNQAAKSFVTLFGWEAEPEVPLLVPLIGPLILVYYSLRDTEACTLSNCPKKLA